MNSLLGLILIILGAICLAAAAEASVQPQMYCWDPDLEFPVSCNEDGGDEGDARADDASARQPPPATRRDAVGLLELACHVALIRKAA